MNRRPLPAKVEPIALWKVIVVVELVSLAVVLCFYVVSMRQKNHEQ